MTDAGVRDRSTAGPGLRERKRAAAKAHVAEVAIGLFFERGYGEVSITEICEVAGVARRSFFRYFATKEDALLEPIRAMADLFEGAIAGAPAELDDGAALDHALRALGVHVVEQWAWLEHYFRMIEETAALAAAPELQLAGRERAVAGELLRRRGETGAADWRLRLRVGCGIAAFRVWLDDMRAGAAVEPVAHLDRVLAALRAG
ncbi:helix-turn-helix domain-containing protein [Conexibacter stalactiti]|uniref:Helix-turn-helix domain-containing protein n=1 Tax=Conexibacter stalactiti TaxID=1940611 RepID=A0ABU4HK69_9ACTN|nr:helix-turn-helix domain-containing protein [Conexibacter stalactiti]MDW5593099.1 helix-turn-helix domain-containing protein [Conexibacter stalactiti]MEC5033740.1 helix-turn-helix domain-containing protein [Conexibacter stalactiti]